MSERQAEIASIETEMADPALFGRHPARFAQLAARSGPARAELEAHELEWLELEEKREALART